MSGSPTTVKQTTARLAPSMRMDADLGDWDRSLLNVPDRPIGPDPVEPLSRRVGGLLLRAQLPDAVPQGGRRRARWNSGGRERAGGPGRT